jgi:hypothetical protein
LQHPVHDQRHPCFIGAIVIRRYRFALAPQLLHASADCCEVIGGARSYHVLSPIRFFGFFYRWQDWLIVVAGASGGIESWIGRLTDRHPQPFRVLTAASGKW